MKRVWIVVFILLFLFGCSNKNDMDQLGKEESQFENLNKEIQKLKEENEQLKTDLSDYNNDLQVGDRASRRIMSLISKGKFEELKTEFNVEFEVKNGEIDFGVPEGNIPFRVDLGGYPMSISYINKHPDGVELTYFIYEKEDSHSVTMSFDKDMKFQFIYAAGR
ncbi:outer membrane murein-binding lipoprotein Lpp [Sporosarcina luteola]|nr:outer membrane murein-binding lipoprotein Lpp [Sporosarcina luteola]